MESSNEGRLGLRKIGGFNWKGKTFYEISSIIQKNGLLPMTKAVPKMFLKSISFVKNVYS